MFLNQKIINNKLVIAFKEQLIYSYYNGSFFGCIHYSHLLFFVDILKAETIPKLQH